MKEMSVIFRDPKEVQEFVAIVAKYPCNMDMKRGKFIIDAKSILGILGHGTGQVMKLQIQEDDCTALMDDIQRFCLSPCSEFLYNQS